jgi:hypothetical protein
MPEKSPEPIAGDREAALVDQPVMVAAKQDEVVERRLSALRPMADVVGVDVTVPLATRELTALVA